MVTNKYQLDYAAGKPAMYARKSREQKARRAIKTLEDFFGKGKLNNMVALNVGSSTGIIDNVLAKKIGKVTGIDIDKKAVEFAQKTFKKKNLKFKIGDAMKLGFKNNTFDIVFCMQIYEHVPDMYKLFKEIYRVLKPGGVCYFAAGNRLWPWEYHYNLPFLSWLPKNLARYYVRLFGRSNEYYENLRTHWGLMKLTKDFKRIEYTSEILKNPKKYGYDDSLPPGKIQTYLAFLISPLAKYFAPSFFWILLKEE